MTRTIRNTIIGVLSFGMVWVSLSVISSLATRYPITDCLTSHHLADCE